MTSLIGPLLFLIYINDIVVDINSSVRLFADDTSLYLIVDNPAEAARCINSDLERMHQWAERWLVKFNAYIGKLGVLAQGGKTPQRSLTRFARSFALSQNAPVYLYTEKRTTGKNKKKKQKKPH